MKQKRLVVLILLVLTLTVTAGVSATPAQQDDLVTVRIGWSGSPDSLNPGAALLLESYTIYGLVYDAMYTYNLDGSYSLNLAESVETSEDGTVWTYHLHPGIQFHDGEPLTADDVVFSYNLYQNTLDFPFMPTYTDYFANVEAVDDLTVVITLSEAIPNIESQLIFLYVLPEHIWADYADNGAEFLNEDMLGSGPFKFVDYSQSEFVQLAANPNHHLHPPKVDEIVFQTFDNLDALVQALRTGQVDMITEMPATAVIGLRNESDIDVAIGSPLGPLVSDIIFNMISDENCPPEDGVCSGHPALKDLQVRLAMAHAVDKQQLIDVALLGLGTSGLTLIPEGLGMWYNDSLEDYAYDINLANQILDEAGYADTDDDGVREMPDGGNPLVFRVNWPSDNVNLPRVADMLHDMWMQIGIETVLQVLDSDALLAINTPAYDFDIILWGWGSDPDPSLLLSVMLTDSIAEEFNETGYSNPVYDDLYVQQQLTLDLEQRRDIIWEMQRIVFEDLPYIIPYYELAAQAYRTDRFTGWITDGGKLALEDASSLVTIEPAN